MHPEYSKEIFYYWLSTLGRNHRKFYELLISTYGDNKSIWDASYDRNNLSIFDEKDKIVGRFFDEKLKENAIRIIDKAHNKGENIITLSDDNYPELLKNIPSPPMVLFYYGKLPCEVNIAMHLLSVVGSRTCTPYGIMSTKKIISDLSKHNFGIVSGMARGIDTEAHRASLEFGMYTIAVLACGADVVYPPENRDLYEEIKDKGLIISEMPPETIPDKRFFPARNRIIAGLSEGTLVTEANNSSGSMITVDRAIEYNRNVYAIPGNIMSPCSNGTNGLIKSGAVCITEGTDILKDLGLENLTEKSTSSGWLCGLSGNECAVAKSISCGNYTCDDISNDTGIESSSVGSALIMLEIRGIVTCMPGGFYRLK